MQYDTQRSNTLHPDPLRARTNFTAAFLDSGGSANRANAERERRVCLWKGPDEIGPKPPVPHRFFALEGICLGEKATLVQGSACYLVCYTVHTNSVDPRHTSRPIYEK